MDPSTIKSRDRTSQNVIEGLKQIYSQLLKPIEEMYHFDKFDYETITDAELDAKPSVLVLGQYSTGKTSLIKYLIGRDYPSIHIGPEPTTDRFISILHGEEERTVKGNSLTVVKELPFSGLNKFGSAFLSKFEASVTPSPLLRNLTFVDTPGVLAGEKQRSSRNYDFAKVCKWFADRADLVLLLFDAHKLDVSDEFKEVIEGLKDQDDKVRCVLNKADQIDREKLMRVYGALMWSMGKIFRSAEVSRVYVGSFWDRHKGTTNPNEGGAGAASSSPGAGGGGGGGGGAPAETFPDNLELFAQDEAQLLREIADLPSNSAVRKVNEIVKRVRLVKVHVCLLSHLRARMPRLFGQAFAQQRLLAHLPRVFEEVKQQFHLSDGDMPDLEEFGRCLQGFHFAEFPRLNRRILQHLDEVLARDIPEVLAKVGGIDKVMKFSQLEIEDTEEDLALKEKMQKARMDALAKGSYGLSKTIKRMRALGANAKQKVAERKANEPPPKPKTWIQDNIMVVAPVVVVCVLLLLLVLTKILIMNGVIPADWLTSSSFVKPEAAPTGQATVDILEHTQDFLYDGNRNGMATGSGGFVGGGREQQEDL